MVVFGKNWENFNSHPGNPRGYPKCTSTVGIPRLIAPPPHYPHPDTPWSTTTGYKYCGITAKHGVRMNFLNLTGIPHIALEVPLGSNDNIEFFKHFMNILQRRNMPHFKAFGMINL